MADDIVNRVPLRSRLSSWLQWLCVFGIFALLVISLLGPAFQERPQSYRRSCENKLKQIAVALQNYHDVHQRFPPAYTVDKDGKPLHSWRVLLLPFLEQTIAYRELDLKQPWNSARNWAVLEKLDASEFHCYETQENPHDTSYVAVVGEETAWPSGKGISPRAMPDGPAQTILLVEVANSGIHWAEPRDLPLQQAELGINPPHVKLAISSGHGDGAHVAYCNSRVEFLRNDTGLEHLRGMLTRNGKEPLEVDKDGRVLHDAAPN